MSTGIDEQIKPPLEFFPMDEARDKQVKALDFTRRAREQGYEEIVIEAPTGIGKSAVGAAIAFWSTQKITDGDWGPGAYYLVTQKLLQDQLSHDIQHFREGLRGGCSLKSSIEYPCPQYGSCMVGMRMKKEKRCESAKRDQCNYRLAKSFFQANALAITNYPYFFTERTYSGELKTRQVIIADECHTLEKQILGFVELTVSREIVNEWVPHLKPIPSLPTLPKFIAWLKSHYIPALESRLENLETRLELAPDDRRLQDEVNKMENHFGRTHAAIQMIEIDPHNWVYWQEQTQDGDIESIAKPIDAAPFFKDLLGDASKIRIYMSAYPGPKHIFCRSLGLNPSKVAWLKLSSTFPVANRPIHMMLVGSMGQRSIDETLPRMLRMCERILGAHAKEKGLIHCHSYKLGVAIYEHLRKNFGSRVLFAKNSQERNTCFEVHQSSSEPTVLLSPSMTEGFNLVEDLARFQILAKVPYPYLGDKQVAAKRDRDPEWYAMQTVMTVIQACGRIVRSDTDTGTTYILDSDFQMLWDKHGGFFPQWFQDAFVWHTKK